MSHREDAIKTLATMIAGCSIFILVIMGGIYKLIDARFDKLEEMLNELKEEEEK